MKFSMKGPKGLIGDVKTGNGFYAKTASLNINGQAGLFSPDLNIGALLIKNTYPALEKMAKAIAEDNISMGTIPIKTGYLSKESLEIRKEDIFKVAMAYRVDYAELVWFKNISGETKWVFYQFNFNKDKYLEQLFKDIILGVGV